jgi:hypothetical protein
MDPILVDIGKQSPILLLVLILLKWGREEGMRFLKALREIQTEARDDARDARESMRRMQEETSRVLEASSVALARNADATRSLELRLERLHVPRESNGGSE